MAVGLTFVPRSHAITILTGPSFTPATNAPLAGLLKLTTDVPSRLRVQVSDGTNTWERGFYDLATNRSVPLLGFKPGRTNQIRVTVCDKFRNACAATPSLTFVPAALPASLPRFTVLKCEPDKMEPGYTLFIVHPNSGTTGHYIVILDNTGEVVWYSPAPTTTSFDVRQLDNGDLFTEANGFTELNLLGQTVKTWAAASGYPVNVHEGVPTSHGTILYLSDVGRSVTNFPSSVASNAIRWTANVNDNPVVEISATNGALLNAWPLVPMLDPTRISYLTYEFYTFYGVDNIHANTIIDVTNDNSIIVSLRNQNAVVKFSRSGQLKWILGTHANWGPAFQPYLLTPVGTPFEWNYGQHSPKFTPQGTLLLYDNGDQRASPFDPPVADQANYSRAVEYLIDETNMTVSQVWDSTTADTNRLFSLVMGDADWLPQRQNVLVTHAYVTYVNGVHPSTYATNAMMGRIREVTHGSPPEVVFDVAFFDYTNRSPSYAGCYIYRSDRIPDLYPHPVAPVTHAVLRCQGQTCHLEFSADPALGYLIQTSTDLANWTTVGSPVPQNAPGDFDFDDLVADPPAARFYRVVTSRSGAGRQ
jgi:arylsulfate sulfotransferase